MWKLHPAMAPREKAGKHVRSESPGKPEVGASAAPLVPLVTIARGLAEIVTEHGLTELILDTKEITLTVRRGVAPVVGGPVSAMAAMAAPVALPLPPSGVAAAAPATRVDDKSHTVTSPFVGTFYRKPNPDSPAYVSLGDRVAKGQVLCIVEAMKLMNEIEADAAGTILAILVEDNQPVEYGQALFKIAP
jgi:acetyl-CoA carboxylase biotin carboxyl carrier protein